MKPNECLDEHIRHEKISPLAEVKKGVFSTLSFLTQIPVNDPASLENFFRILVKETLRLVKAQKVILSFPRGPISALSDFLKKNNEVGFSVSIPLVTQENGFTIGFLTVNKERGKSVTQRELELLKTLAHIAAIKTQNAVFQQVICQGVIETLRVLVNVVEARDVYTRFHSQRVARYALGIAEHMNLPQEDKDVLKIAALLHDIGKLVIPDSILLKPDKLTPEEFEIVKYHPVVGDEILAPLRFFQKERQVVRYHHERWDGSGYPEGLFGESIPLLARIAAVADSFDAMTSERLYRKSMSFEAAFKEIKELANIKYDPAVVNAFEIFLNKRYGIKT